MGHLLSQVGAAVVGWSSLGFTDQDKLLGPLPGTITSVIWQLWLDHDTAKLFTNCETIVHHSCDVAEMFVLVVLKIVCD